MQRTFAFFCVFFFGFFTAFWYWSASLLENAVGEKISQWQSKGYFTRYNDLRVEGFPFSLILEITDLSVSSVMDEQEEKIIETEYVSMSASLLDPITFLEQELGGDGFDLKNLQDIQIFAGNLKLPKNSASSLSDTIDSVDVTLFANGIIESNNIQTWHNGNVAFDFKSIDVMWGDVNFLGAGEISLDDRFQLAGTLNTQTSGLASLLKELGARGTISKKTASIATLGVNFFSLPVTKTNANGVTTSKDTISLPVNFDKGSIWLGPIELLHIGPIVK